MDSRLDTALAGHYTIDREIGRGGMAVVYLARDVRHNRNVALKVLNPELGAVLGVERFLAEIQVTANLQHPNLLPLFDSGEANGMLYYVMPYVEGESLRKRLQREKQLPVDEAVRIACSIANALDYAHRHKVIHRDLKPENILMHEGQPLVADFGIALAVSNAGGARITQTGLSLGTPHYMSPEQATGDRVVDGRTDIYSLGAMTYEMLVGDPPHSASTSQAIIAKVLTEKARSVRADRPTVPPHVDAAVSRALEKLAADRFATAKEFADALDGRTASIPFRSPTDLAVPSRTKRGSRREVALAGVALVLTALLGWQALRDPAVPEQHVVRANYDVPPGTRITDLLTGPTMALAPRGDLIAFTTIDLSGGRYVIWMRRTQDLAAREVTNDVGRNLAFSPDGRWLAFTEGNVIKKLAVDGGQTATLGSTGSSVPYGLAWGANDTIYIGSFSGLWAIPAAGGTGVPSGPSENYAAGARTGQRWPLLTPDGKAVLFAGGSSSTSPNRLGVLVRASRTVEQFDPLVSGLLGFVDNYLIYVTPAGTLMAIAWDGSEQRPVGQSIQLEEGIVVDPNAGAKAALSRSGTLMYLRGRSQFQATLASPSGTTTPLIRELASYQSPRYSPDGSRVAITVFGANATDIYVYSIARNTFTRLTTEGQNIRPEWTPDGRTIVFIGDRGGKTGIWSQPADGSGPAELLYQPEFEPFEVVVSPDGKWLVVRSAPGDKFPRDIVAVPMTGERTMTPLVTGPFTESQPRISPDGRWLAYQSNETGRFEIYVRPFPGRGARVQVSDAGATEPIWGRSGTRLYYRQVTGEVVEVAVTTGANFSIGQRKVVLKGDFLADATHANYDVAPDGRFLVLKRAGAEAQTIIVHNWAREVREKTAARK